MEYDEFGPNALDTPVQSVIPHREILDVKFMDVVGGTIKELEMMQLKSRSRITHDLKDKGALKKRILEYIHIRSTENLPVRLMDINRVFQHPARRLGIPVKLIGQNLLETQRVIELEQSNVSALFSNAIWNQIVEANAGSAAGLPARLMANIGL